MWVISEGSGQQLHFPPDPKVGHLTPVLRGGCQERAPQRRDRQVREEGKREEERCDSSIRSSRLRVEIERDNSLKRREKDRARVREVDQVFGELTAGRERESMEGRAGSRADRGR